VVGRLAAGPGLEPRIEVLETHEPGVRSVHHSRNVEHERLNVAVVRRVRRSGAIRTDVVPQTIRVELLGLRRVIDSERTVRVEIEPEFRERMTELNEGRASS